jgi:TetR/AcrR family transcriptional regulator, cholesterol catabolism regulator
MPRDWGTRREICSVSRWARVGGGAVNIPVTQPDSAVVPLTDMTSRQLIRRAKIIEAVIELIADVGAEAVQMRDVAKRSGVALATVYRYFNSKDYLLAAALEDWQKRLTRRCQASWTTYDVPSGRSTATPI